MKEDNLLYGAHSGIQKAVRRGDLDLAKTCFELLWGEKKHRDWLRWRVSSIVLEEAWFMAYELPELYSEKEDANKWLSFFYGLCLVKKCKDAGAIWNFPVAIEHEELLAVAGAKEKFGIEENKYDFVEMSDFLSSVVKGSRELSDVESKALAAIKGRARMGGMLSDRIMSLASLILLASRSINVGDIEDLKESGLRRWVSVNGMRKPRTVNLPWYVFDMHTRVGMWAENIVMKRYSEEFSLSSKAQLDSMWFFFESAFVPDSLIEVGEPKHLMSWNQFWWDKMVEVEIKGFPKVWNSGLAKAVENVVNWCIKKMEE